MDVKWCKMNVNIRTTFELRSDYVQITFNYVQIAFNLCNNNVKITLFFQFFLGIFWAFQKMIGFYENWLKNQLTQCFLHNFWMDHHKSWCDPRFADRLCKEKLVALGESQHAPMHTWNGFNNIQKSILETVTHIVWPMKTIIHTSRVQWTYGDQCINPCMSCYGWCFMS